MSTKIEWADLTINPVVGCSTAWSTTHFRRRKMNAEQWLNTLVAKADAATPGEWHEDETAFSWGRKILNTENHEVIDDGSSGGEYGEKTTQENMTFIAAANPITVKRLVAMVRLLATRAGASLSCPYDGVNAVRPAGWRCPTPGHACSNAHLCEIDAAYQRTRYEEATP